MKAKKKKKKHSVIKILIKILMLIIILDVVFAGYMYLSEKRDLDDIFKEAEEKRASVTEYIVYGTHLNISGNLEISDLSGIKDVKLAFRYIDDEEQEELIDLEYDETSDGIEFYTSELINDGIDLENLSIGQYYLFIKIEYAEDEVKYYSLKNGTEYDDDIDYYTITKNNSNNKVSIKFDTYNLSEDTSDIPFMYIEVIKTKLPSDVYDIVIDPGHRRSRCWSC